MEKEIVQNLVAGAITLALGAFAWMARTIFSKIEHELSTLGKGQAKLDGKLDSLQTEIRANTVSMTEARAELKAVWRFIDNAHERASDSNGRF